jgi:Kelch motif protein
MGDTLSDERAAPELAAAQLEGKVYAVGGLGGRGNANEIYDPAADAWSLGADFPTVTDHP